MTTLEREEFNAWVRARIGTMFSPGAPESSDFYYAIWCAGKASAVERLRKDRDSLTGACLHCGRGGWPI